MLKHEEIEERGMVEAYVRRRLAPEDCAAFEEHYFQCASCFDEVQLVEKFIAGVDHAARTGLLDPEQKPAPQTRTWFMPAFAFTAAAAVVLASVLTFVLLIRQPAREVRLQQELQQALSQARDSQARVAELDRRAALDAAPQANVPVVILTANRSADSASKLQTGPAVRAALLWIDVPPQPPGTKFHVTISTTRFSKTIGGLERNSNGALTVSIPVRELAPGAWLVRLYREPEQLVAEYRLDVGP